MKILFLEADSILKQDRLTADGRCELVNFICESTGCKCVVVQGYNLELSDLINGGINKKHMLDRILVAWDVPREIQNYETGYRRWLKNYRKHRKKRDDCLGVTDWAILAFSSWKWWGEGARHRMVQLGPISGLTMKEALEVIALLV